MSTEVFAALLSIALNMNARAVVWVRGAIESAAACFRSHTKPEHTNRVPRVDMRSSPSDTPNVSQALTCRGALYRQLLRKSSNQPNQQRAKCGRFYFVPPVNTANS